MLLWHSVNAVNSVNEALSTVSTLSNSAENPKSAYSHVTISRYSDQTIMQFQFLEIGLSSKFLQNRICLSVPLRGFQVSEKAAASVR